MGEKRSMEPSSFQVIVACSFVSDLRLSKVVHRRGHRRGLAFFLAALPSPCPFVPSVREGVGARDSVSGCVETL